MPAVNKDELMLRMQALEFTAVDLNLYLDTHPCDARALADFNQVAAALAQTVAVYEQMYGPLTNFGRSQSCGRWACVEQPWPWETQG